MAWLGILRAILSLAQLVAQLVRDRRLIDAGKAEQLLKNLKESNDVLSGAEDARDAALKRHDDSGGVPDERDPHLRD